MTAPGTAIKVARERLGLSPQMLAEKLKVSLPAYCDIEDYEHEAYSGVDSGTIRMICDVLGLSIFSLFNVEPPRDQGLPKSIRSDLVKNARESMHLTQLELADRIGFDQFIIQRIENEPDFLNTWPVELIIELARVLNIPPGELL